MSEIDFGEAIKSTEGERQETHRSMISSCVRSSSCLEVLVHVYVVHGSSEMLRKKIQFGGLISTESQCWLYDQRDPTANTS